MDERTITVEVVHAQSGQSILRRVRLPTGSTVIQAIEASGIPAMLSEGAVDCRQAGIFSQKVALDHVVEEGDRIELYRPLMLDPMEARRRRAR
jgi:putative ubiquitin-RnfH superfamily antitoxin RatB of RatAB toxin-antitoxin module